MICDNIAVWDLWFGVFLAWVLAYWMLVWWVLAGASLPRVLLCVSLEASGFVVIMRWAGWWWFKAGVLLGLWVVSWSCL